VEKYGMSKEQDNCRSLHNITYKVNYKVNDELGLPKFLGAAFFFFCLFA
jgi:hypothetical protein